MVLLAKEGIVTWAAGELHLTWLLNGILALPVVGGPSLSVSYIGTFLVFLVGMALQVRALRRGRTTLAQPAT